MASPARDGLFDRNAEQAVIGSLLIDPQCFDNVARIVTPLDFEIETCRWAFEAARHLHQQGQAIDLLTLETELTRRGHWQEMRGFSFLADCETTTPSALHATSYARVVADFSQRRRAVALCESLAKSALVGDGRFAPELDLTAKTLLAMAEGLKPSKDLDRFKIHWAEEALQPQPPIDWRIEPLFSAGSVSLVVGEGGHGKTWAMLDAGLCHAVGGKWLDFTARQGLTLLIDEESGARRMARRLGDVLRGHDANERSPIGYVSLACLSLYEQDDIAELRAAIVGTGAQLVIIDALASVMPGGDENSVKDVQPVFHTLRTIAEESSAAIVVIHHANKMGGYRGSSALKGAVDLLLMVRKDGNTLTFISEKTRDTEPIKFAAVMNFWPGKFWLSPNQAQQVADQLSPSQSCVVEYLTDNGDSTIKDIVDNVSGCKSQAARKAVYSLARLGKIERKDRGTRGESAIYGLVTAGLFDPAVSDT